MSHSSTGGTPLGAIDTHAHVFSHSAQMANGRRYTPAYTASLENYLQQLDALNLASGVLIQPSFFGYDNSQLIQALAQSNGRCKGVAVLPPTTSSNEIETLARNGVTGIRLNLFGQPIPDLAGPEWQAFLHRVNALSWHVEVHCPVDQLPSVIPSLQAAGCSIVVDHYGRPDFSAGTHSKELDYLCSTADSGKVWVKLSAPYRVWPSIDVEHMAPAVQTLKAHFGTERLMWGSDWPHTQHESATWASLSLHTLQSLLTSTHDQEQVLVTTPRSLFQF